MEFTIVYNIVETGDQAFSPDTEVGRIMGLSTWIVHMLYIMIGWFFFFLAVKFTPRSVKHYKHPVMVVGCDSPSVLIDISVDSIPSELYVTYSYSVKFQVCIEIICNLRRFYCIINRTTFREPNLWQDWHQMVTSGKLPIQEQNCSCCLIYWQYSFLLSFFHLYSYIMD